MRERQEGDLRGGGAVRCPLRIEFFEFQMPRHLVQRLARHEPLLGTFISHEQIYLFIFNLKGSNLFYFILDEL